jgi:hypothetical protein
MRPKLECRAHASKQYDHHVMGRVHARNVRSLNAAIKHDDHHAFVCEA